MREARAFGHVRKTNETSALERKIGMCGVEEGNGKANLVLLII